MRIDDWFFDWADRHCARFPRGDWPPLGDEFWAALRHTFVKHGVTESVAEAASLRLFEDPPAFVDAHPRAILSLAQAVRREQDACMAQAVRPQATTEDHREWDREALRTWDQLTEDDRSVWLQLVHDRAPFFRGRSAQMLAVAWAHDPSSVINLPPLPDASLARNMGLRRIFEPVAWRDQP